MRTPSETPLNLIDYVLFDVALEHMTHLAASGTSVALDYIIQCMRE